MWLALYRLHASARARLARSPQGTHPMEQYTTTQAAARALRQARKRLAHAPRALAEEKGIRARRRDLGRFEKARRQRDEAWDFEQELLALEGEGAV